MKKEIIVKIKDVVTLKTHPDLFNFSIKINLKAPMIKIKSLFCIFAVFALFSCNRYPAPIIDNSDIIYKKADLSKYFTKYSDPIRNDSKEKYIIVTSGDSLYKIAKRYNSSTKDIINRNDLSPPFILPIGKKIYIPMPNFHIVKKGESLYSISRNYDININKIASTNKLSRPYSIKPGQKLAINANMSISRRNNHTRVNKARKRKYPVSHSRSVARAGFSWPIKGNVISGFGPKNKGLYNDGINIKASQGATVRASQGGTVAYVGNELKGYGNLIIIKHSNKMITAYGHLSKTTVKRGEKVTKQQAIAHVGSTGNVNSSQLYFGLRRGRDAINPQHYLKN